MVVATGAAYRRLPAPGADDLAGRGVFYGAAAHEARHTAGDDVYVVGSANSAGQAAMNFSQHARSATILCRGGGLRANMSQYLVDQIEGRPNIAVEAHTEVAEVLPGRTEPPAGGQAASSGERSSLGEVHGGERLERLRLRDRQTGEEREVTANWLFVFIGAAPCVGWLPDSVRRDEHGFLLTGPDLFAPPRPSTGGPRGDGGWPLERDPFFLETSVPGVFAAGDVRRGSVERVASAVGEGAMVVTLVHRYLETS